MRITEIAPSRGRLKVNLNVRKPDFSSLGVAFFVIFFSLFLGVSSFAFSQSTPSYGCPNSDLLGPRLITGICWDCAFPWRMMGGVTFGGSAPKSATKSSCTCNDSKGVPKPGTTAGFWNPARLIEVVRNPWCSPAVGGKKLMEAYRLVGNSRPGPQEDTFMNVHLLAFPVMQMLELRFSTLSAILKVTSTSTSFRCPKLIRLTMMQNSTSSQIRLVLLLPSLETLAGGAAACVAETAGQETDEMFWWSGCIGPLFPHDGAYSPYRINGESKDPSWHSLSCENAHSRPHQAHDGRCCALQW